MAQIWLGKRAAGLKSDTARMTTMLRPCRDRAAAAEPLWCGKNRHAGRHIGRVFGPVNYAASLGMHVIFSVRPAMAAAAH